jgi:hypothetical protein
MLLVKNSELVYVKDGRFDLNVKLVCAVVVRGECCDTRARARVCVCVFVDVLLSASLGTALQLLRRGKRSDLCCRARLNDCFR